MKLKEIQLESRWIQENEIAKLGTGNLEGWCCGSRGKTVVEIGNYSKDKWHRSNKAGS